MKTHKKKKNWNLTKETLEAMKESQEHELRANKAIVRLAGSDSNEEANKKFKNVIAMIRSEKHKEANEKIAETIER